MLSVIIPTYNSAPFILETFREITAYLENLGEDYELLFVDDGSRDPTAALLGKSCQGQPRVRLIQNGENRGKGYTVRKGMQEARGDFMIFTDADLAYPPPEMGKILEALQSGADLAIATRVAPESRFIMSPKFFGYLYTRHVGSRAFNWLVRRTLGLTITDTQAGLKGFNRKARDIIFARQRLESFTFDVELIYIAKKFDLRLQEVPVVFRYFSEPTTVSFLIQSLGSLRDLAAIRSKDRKGDYR
ncbi:MAG: glycosyltransferase [Deltaproteobacteria bacterium]|nr:glycosyltransferase [Deltaproteobacteria bacterium]